VIFIHGCFWHRHEGCSLARLPKSRLDFWLPKLEGNKLRDRAKTDALETSGWKVLIVWECQLRHREDLAVRLREFLEGKDGVDDESC
jgi:DNA mismatch endonuclease (patch repair protein)